jgi:hypothetical protein
MLTNDACNAPSALRQEQDQVNRHGNAEQRQTQSHNHTLLGEGAVQELMMV